MKAYHYTSGQGLFNILNSQELQCSNLRFMNDPSEEFYFDNLLQELFDSDGGELESIYHTLYNKSYDKVVLNPTDKFIASFSKNSDSLSMWNYYSKGNGYNLEVDLQGIIVKNRTKNLSIRLIKLDYNKSNHDQFLKDLILEHKEKAKIYSNLTDESASGNTMNREGYILNQMQNIAEEFNDELDKLKIQFKHPAYAREDEVRLIISESPGLKEGQKVEFKPSPSGVFISYISLDISGCISGVTTHPLNGELHKLGVEEFLKSKSEFRNIEVKASGIPFREV